MVSTSVSSDATGTVWRVLTLRSSNGISKLRSSTVTIRPRIRWFWRNRVLSGML